jgi:hypothetical protein
MMTKTGHGVASVCIASKYAEQEATPNTAWLQHRHAALLLTLLHFVPCDAAYQPLEKHLAHSLRRNAW